MGLTSSKNKICTDCHHYHHANLQCADYSYTNFIQCDCITQKSIKDFPPITIISPMFYPDIRCDKCSELCKCKQCNCLKCINKKKFKQKKYSKHKHPKIATAYV
jgi:hypothetical protein